MKVITICSAKGGVGKTSTTVNLANVYRDMGKKVLVIDFDHNNNTTDYYLRDVGIEDILETNIMKVLTREKKLAECIFEAGNGVHVIPSIPALWKATGLLINDRGIFNHIKNQLSKMDYDVVIVDTCPSISIELHIALYIADHILVPIRRDRWVIQGYALIAEEVEKLMEIGGMNPDLSGLKYHVTEVDLRVFDAIGNIPFKNSIIRQSDTIRTHNTEGVPLSPKTKAWAEFEALAKEVLNV